ncbi:MAG: TRAP transporter large permease subunit [Sedimenticola selenatireducens]|uniref:TRAP transporter large permease protein n=2 Tax=Sedimenticola selenatireducens TaxID=191960 RepID=A0A558DWW2_9GAMM|nr:TRAP transporter large permease subunit [Sedimenticola selenatireducens]TVO71630.1 TRAP transporter large permease subunit [Sedimenticola selenatireducens]TVT65544.1 MAG: TRAP transporter large permease subunit [Sedimenticola selenatireducens]
MEMNEILVIAMFVSFIALLFTGFPVAWALAGVGVAFAGIGYLADAHLDTMTGLDYSTLGLAVGRIFGIMDNWVLVALPMFIFMGLMLDKSGVAERMMHAMQGLFGRVRGGLAISVTLIGIILAASTGIIGASVVLLGVMSLPVMMRQKYSKTLALGTVAGAGCLGILIPPSIMLVIMGDQMGLSVGDLFMGAVFPGIILGVFYILYILGFSFFKPASAPLAEDVQPVSMTVVWGVFKTILPPAALILAVLGSIFAGIATVTEASGIGALGAIVMAASYRQLNWAVMKEVTINTFNTSAYIFAIFVGATVFALVLRELGGDELIESTLTGLPFGPYGIIAFILVVVFLLGFFLDWIEISLIILPLLAPVIKGLGLDIDGHGVVDNPELVWFALLVAVTLQTSFLTPPVGFALFYLKGVCPPGISLMDIYKGVIPFIILQLLGLLVVAFFPDVVTWLPSVAYGK